MTTLNLRKLNPPIGETWCNVKNDFIKTWNNSQRGDWMLWLARNIGVEKRLLTLVAGLCAETASHLMKDERSKNAVKMAIAYGNGKIKDINLYYAYLSSGEAWYDISSSAGINYESSSYAASAAANSAGVYTNVACVHLAASDAASAAYMHAKDTGLDAENACNKIRKKQAAICRTHLTDAVIQLLDNIDKSLGWWNTLTEEEKTMLSNKYYDGRKPISADEVEYIYEIEISKS